MLGSCGLESDGSSLNYSEGELGPGDGSRLNYSVGQLRPGK